MHVHSISTVSHINGHKACPARPLAIGPARPGWHFVPGHAGPWAAPPAQARPTSCRAVPCRPEGIGGPSGLFKISLFFVPPLWAISYV